MSTASTKRQENKKWQAEAETGLNVPIEIYFLTRKNI